MIDADRQSDTMHSSHRLTVARLLPIVIGALLAAPAGGQLPLSQPRAGFVPSVTSSPLVEPDRSRGEVAIRGIFWGAVVGGFLGYHADSGSDGVLPSLRALGGAAVGAPIGMVVHLLATRF
jgi:hypothetical protein